jgi:hypothetical protein
MFRTICCVVLPAMGLSLSCSAQTAALKPIDPNATARTANSETIYGALRSALPAGEAYPVKDFTLEREGGVFHFEDGQFVLYAPVQGKVTGAAFVGKGSFELTPASAAEQKMLAVLTKGARMHEDFTTVAMRFTDGTAEEIRKASAGAAAQTVSGATQAGQELARSLRTKLHENVALRLLEDVSSGGQGGYFLASFRAGGFFGGKNVLFGVDPQEQPDQVSLRTWSTDEGADVWAAYRMQTRAARGPSAHVTREDIDLTMDKGGKLAGKAIVTLESYRDGVRVVPLEMYPTLRVSGVYQESGAPLDFIQEGKDDDPQFAVELAEPMKGETPVRVLVTYGGPDAVERVGPDIYDLKHGARDSWYPADPASFNHFAAFRITFHLPKGLTAVATGDLVSSTAEAGGEKIVWEAKQPLPVAGFNIGNFKKEQMPTPDGFGVDAYADVSVPDWVAQYANSGMGTLVTTPGLKNQVAQGNAAIQIYTDYFGKLPYDHVSLTQQNSCLDGQGWPTMVYLPICSYWDATIQNAFGLRQFGIGEFWSELTPHEVSHQWWGDLVGIASYRDQWMSEGFATFSAGLYLLHTRKTMDDYRAYWKTQRDHLVEKNNFGMRPIDVGPLTMGYRVNTSKTGDWNAQYLIYAKGAYILHMLEMLYWTPQMKETPFKHSMQEFVKEYAGKSPTTEDFKAVIEKTMPKWMDVDGNGKLDWFFNEYVYGTELPHYDVASDFTTGADGTTTMHFKVAQSKVSPQFRMLVPFYLQMADGNTVRIANLTLKGDDAVEKTVNLGKLPSPAKKALVNYNYDVLSD